MIIREYPDGTVDVLTRVRCYYASSSRLTATVSLPVSFSDPPVVNVTPEGIGTESTGISCRYELSDNAPYNSVIVNITDHNNSFSSGWARDASVRITGQTQ